MTYAGSWRVVPNYNVMGPAKASLESAVRYLAADLGPAGVRVNAVSAGPIATVAARTIKDFSGMLELLESHTPLRRNVTSEEVADATVFLLSDLSRAITGEVVHVDAGAHADHLSAGRDRLLSPRTSPAASRLAAQRRRAAARRTRTIKLLLAAAFWRAVERGELSETQPFAFQPWAQRGRQPACCAASGTPPGSRWPTCVAPHAGRQRQRRHQHRRQLRRPREGQRPGGGARPGADPHAARDDGLRGRGRGRDNLTSARRHGGAAGGARRAASVSAPP